VKVTAEDFQTGKGKSRVVKFDLDFDRLMNYEYSNSNSSSTLSFATDMGEMEMPSQGIEADMYLMDLTTPGLRTPPLSSSRESMRFHELLMNVQRDEVGSTETLVKELPPKFSEALSKKLSQMLDDHWHEELKNSEDGGEISSREKSELAEPLEQFPSEIVDGVLAV
jgi:hypothetical protein